MPNPLRCFQCQSYGHHKASCKATAVCAKCSVSGHDDLSCVVSENSFKCANCSGDHPSWSRLCPKFVSEQKVCDFQVRNDVSFFEARRVVLRDSARTYSAVVSKSTSSFSTQTDLSLDCQGDRCLVPLPGYNSDYQSSQSGDSDSDSSGSVMECEIPAGLPQRVIDFVSSGQACPEPKAGWPWDMIFNQYKLGAFIMGDDGNVLRYERKRTTPTS